MVTGFVKNGERIIKSLCDFCNFLVLSASLTHRHYLEDDLGSGEWGVGRTKLPFAFCLLPPAFCLLPFAFCLLPFASCLLPPAFCLLPFAFCLLPFASCLLPFASCLLPFAS
jgi:hypothetical protein